MRKIAICDDDEAMLERLEGLAGRFMEEQGEAYEVQRFSRPSQLADRYRDGQRPFDIVILDIEMPELDGMSLASKIRAADSGVPILFVTSHERFVYQAYEVEALRYIPKPVVEQTLPGALEAALKKLSREKASIVLQSRGVELRLLLEEILYVEKSGKNCVYHTTGGESYPVRQPIAQAMEALDRERFVLVNSGSAANMAHVKMLDKAGAILIDGTNLPVSRLRAGAVKESLHRYWSSLR